MLLDVYTPDGKRKSEGLLTLSPASGGVRADRAGNIFVSDDVHLPDQPMPPQFALLGAKEQRIYRYIYGSILKFGPDGGKVTVYGRDQKYADDGVAVISSHWSGDRQTRITGQLKTIYPHIAPTGAHGGDCTCYVPRFDIDGFGRLIAPESPLFSVKMLDDNANLLARFGSYGNADSAGTGSKSPEPEIAFVWPAYVAATDEAVYVSDMLNRRIVRVKIGYRVIRACSGDR